MEGLDPAGMSVARWANLPPTGRLSQKALKVARICSRLSAAKWSMQAFQLRGHFSVVTNSRGKPKGKSKPPTHGPGVCKACSNATRLVQACIPSSTKRLSLHAPQASTMDLREEGELLKSQPSRRVMAKNSGATQNGGCCHQLFKQGQRDEARYRIRVQHRKF